MVAIYTAAAVSFDGTNDYLTRGAGLTGAADGKLFTLSFWFWFRGSDATTQRLFDMNSGGTRVTLQKNAANKFSITARNAVAADLIGSGQSTTTYTSAMSAWSWFGLSVDLGNNAMHWYVDGSSVKSGGTTLTNDNLDFTVSNVAVGASIAAAEKSFVDMAEFYFTTEYIDFSVQANREMFRSSAGKPVSLGANGSTPTGTQPLIYLANPLATWKTNLGSGGGFTENGALTSASSSPSD